MALEYSSSATHQPNPIGNLLLLGGAAGAAYYGYQWWQREQVKAALLAEAARLQQQGMSVKDSITKAAAGACVAAAAGAGMPPATSGPLCNGAAVVAIKAAELTAKGAVIAAKAIGHGTAVAGKDIGKVGAAIGKGVAKGTVAVVYKAPVAVGKAVGKTSAKVAVGVAYKAPVALAKGIYHAPVAIAKGVIHAPASVAHAIVHPLDSAKAIAKAPITVPKAIATSIFHAFGFGSSHPPKLGQVNVATGAAVKSGGKDVWPIDLQNCRRLYGITDWKLCGMKFDKKRNAWPVGWSMDSKQNDPGWKPPAPKVVAKVAPKVVAKVAPKVATRINGLGDYEAALADAAPTHRNPLATHARPGGRLVGAATSAGVRRAGRVASPRSEPAYYAGFLAR
jgi:hypothetical protein